jgi:tRNA-splicing endonuclease subunit Sen54
MADASEDSVRAPQGSEDHDPEEEIQDYSFLLKQKLPSRGVKDFEPHNTKLQQSTLEASREAMHLALSPTRFHGPDKSFGVYEPEGNEGNGAWVFNAQGSWGKSVGKVKAVPGRVVQVTDGQGKVKEQKLMRLWLLPEEALWLLERGTLHLRYPAEEGQEEDSGLPMSLQGGYAAFLGGEGEGGLTLEQFTVYQYLKRCGYNVLRARENLHNVPRSVGAAVQDVEKRTPPLSLAEVWRWLLGDLVETRRKFGPVVKPGLYRTYDDIYRQLLMIPFHDPQSQAAVEAPLTQPTDGLTVTWHVYKSSPSFKKTAPGPPDFYIAVMSARDTSLPTDLELDALLRQTPYHAPKADEGLVKKLKGGYRDVILAIVDQGVTSFIDISDAGFGCERLWERETRAGGRGGRGGKRGGGRGRGRGRGRGGKA